MSQIETAFRTIDEAGAGLGTTRTDDGEFLVGGQGGEPVVGVIRRETGRFYCYPCTPGFPRLGPFERLEDAARACRENAAG